MKGSSNSKLFSFVFHKPLRRGGGFSSFEMQHSRTNIFAGCGNLNRPIKNECKRNKTFISTRVNHFLHSKSKSKLAVNFLATRYNFPECVAESLMLAFFKAQTRVSLNSVAVNFYVHFTIYLDEELTKQAAFVINNAVG